MDHWGVLIDMLARLLVDGLNSSYLSSIPFLDVLRWNHLNDPIWLFFLLRYVSHNSRWLNNLFCYKSTWS